MTGPIAAVDCGTNSIRLLITDGGRDIERIARITRLGAGTDRTGHLDPAGIDRTIEVLDSYRALLDRHGVEAVRVIATSASRDAANRDEFFDRAGASIGARPELLTGDEEGRLAFRGATSGLDPSRGPFCVIDLGGGSTEFAIGTHDLEGILSVDVGSVRFTERYVEHDPPRPEELVACLSVTEAHLTDVVRELPGIDDTQTFIGVAGTITTVAAVEIGLITYDPERIHHFELTRAAAEDVYRTLVTEPLADRVHNPGLQAERAEVIVGGSAILVGIMRGLGIDPLLVSEHDILDGVVADLAERSAPG
jgi:exopolyphosphatase / guanosine-5'-triphosphate,3'-diphosphate pyrophosphatase